MNDLVIFYERYSMLMIASHQNGQTFRELGTINNRNLGANNFEKLADIYTPDEITFLTQLRRLRNSIVHYDGHYSATNLLNYTFGTNINNSAGNEGKKITIGYDNILWIYDRLIKIVVIGNTNYFKKYPIA